MENETIVAMKSYLKWYYRQTSVATVIEDSLLDWRSMVKSMQYSMGELAVIVAETTAVGCGSLSNSSVGGEPRIFYRSVHIINHSNTSEIPRLFNDLPAEVQRDLMRMRASVSIHMR